MTESGLVLMENEKGALFGQLDSSGTKYLEFKFFTIFTNRLSKVNNLPTVFHIYITCTEFSVKKKERVKQSMVLDWHIDGQISAAEQLSACCLSHLMLIDPCLNSPHN